MIAKASKPHHYIRLGALARNDLAWWAKALHIFHGWAPFPADVPIPSWSFSTDACFSGGAGYFMGDWFFVDWVSDIPSMLDKNINVFAINKTTSRSLEMMEVIKELFWCSIRNGFKLSALFLPGKLNVVSDRISRMHDFQSACEANVLVVNGFPSVINCYGHMTESAFSSLQTAWTRA